MTGCYGQDWAAYQSPEPSVDGIAFVVIKVTEGLTYENPRYIRQAAHARLHKLVVGHYHYPHMANDPKAEAEHFLRNVFAAPGDFLVLDWEGYDAANKAVSMSRQIAYKKAFLQAVGKTSPTYQLGVYANGDYLSRDPKGTYGDFLWIATGGLAAGHPDIEHPWLFHQYSTAGGVDRDYCHLDAAGLRAWTHAKETDMPLTPAEIQAIAKAVWAFTNKAAGDKHDMHQALDNIETNTAKALTPTIDYVKLAAALIAQLKA